MASTKRSKLELVLRNRFIAGFGQTFDCVLGRNWVDAHLGADSVGLDGEFTAAELRMLADYAEGKRP